MPALPTGATPIIKHVASSQSQTVPVGKVWIVFFLFDIIGTTSTRTITLNGNTIISSNGPVTGRLILRPGDTLAAPSSSTSLLLTGWEVDE